jgi:hypothetical protein
MWQIKNPLTNFRGRSRGCKVIMEAAKVDEMMADDEVSAILFFLLYNSNRTYLHHLL